MIAVLLIWVVCAIGAYFIADKKGLKSPGLHALAGFFLGPLGLIFTMVHEPKGE